MSKGNRLPIKPTLELLWREGFFSNKKDLSGVTEELASRGYNFRPSNLATALMYMVRPNGFLSRKKDSGKWKYTQKAPLESMPDRQDDPFSAYVLHPQILKVSIKQYKNRDYKGAIQNALVEVIDQIKIKVNHPKDKNGKELDGDSLINHVFGCDNQTPKIKFNDLQTSLDKTEQRGIMNLYRGIVGVRNKKAHRNFIQNDPFKTFEYLSLASLLMRLLDEYSTK